MFGTVNVDSHAVECPKCQGIVNDWEEFDITTADKGTKFTCNKCKTQVEIFWGIDEPDHVSTWHYPEKCPHRLCQLKYQEKLAGLTNSEAFDKV